MVLHHAAAHPPGALRLPSACPSGRGAELGVVTISVADAIGLYKRSTLGERRPVDPRDIFRGMLDNANLAVTACHRFFSALMAFWLMQQTSDKRNPLVLRIRTLFSGNSTSSFAR